MPKQEAKKQTAKTTLVQVTEDNICRIFRLPSQSAHEFRRDQLTIYLGNLENWRSWLTINQTESEWTIKKATELAYQSNAIERELWNDTERELEHRSFLPSDTLLIVNRIRARLLSELNKHGKVVPTLESTTQSSSTTDEHIPALILRGCEEGPIVNGKEKGVLTKPQFDVLTALQAAGKDGLTKDALDNKSKHGDSRKILKRLTEKDDDWKSVIVFPGSTGKRYRLRF